jgi:hypothetical protein
MKIIQLHENNTIAWKSYNCMTIIKLHDNNTIAWQ